MTRFGHWMLCHPRSLAWLALMVMVSLALDLFGLDSVNDLVVMR